MLGRYSQFLMRLLSVGHLFLVNVIYATCVLINVLACLWCAASRPLKSGSWHSSAHHRAACYAYLPACLCVLHPAL